MIVSPCGSGKSYLFAKMAEQAKGNVLILTHRRELLEQHTKLLKKLGVWDEGKIRISMVLTEANRLGQHHAPRLILLDEAHLSRSNSWIKIINYYNTFCVGFTATPVRLDGKPLGDIYDTLIEGVSVKWLIEHGNLSPFEYYAPLTVETDGVRKHAGDYVTSDLEKLMCSRAIYGNVISSYQKLAYGQRAIAYCVSVKHAEQVADEFCKAGIVARAISARTPDKERQETMEEFRKGSVTVLCNVGIISEGVSIDEVWCCMLLRPTESHALYWQQAMRCMRYQKEKVAKILDFVGNYTRNPLPDEPVIWSLTKPSRPRKEINEAGDFYVRVCPYCFKTFKTASICPYCKAEYPLHPKEIQAHADVELKQIKAADAARIAEEKKRLRQEVGMAKTYPELLRIAKERGYSRGWVYIQMKLKGKK